MGTRAISPKWETVVVYAHKLGCIEGCGLAGVVTESLPPSLLLLSSLTCSSQYLIPFLSTPRGLGSIISRFTLFLRLMLQSSCSSQDNYGMIKFTDLTFWSLLNYHQLEIFYCFTDKIYKRKHNIPELDIILDLIN